jgi:hypothetical protein
MKTFIPKQTKLTKERIEAKLEIGLIQTLERYCQYLDSDRDYIVSQALAIAFKKDKGFAQWLKTRELQGPAGEKATPGASPQGRGRERTGGAFRQVASSEPATISLKG